MRTIQVFLIEKNSNKKSQKCNYKSNSGKCEKVEKLIVCSSKILIYIVYSNTIYEKFHDSRDNKYFFMNSVEKYEKNKIEKWKKCHKSYSDWIYISRV